MGKGRGSDRSGGGRDDVVPKELGHAPRQIEGTEEVTEARHNVLGNNTVIEHDGAKHLDLKKTLGGC